ncbi:MAG: hypothetical protein J0I06_21160 [Planctomycetes bacterium]|nr:hypothetical protein [Planctomycetota bacterium]
MDDADFKKLTPGRIIRAGVLDPQGRGWKVRPLVVLTQPDSNDPEAEFRVAAGSTQSPVEGNESLAVEVPGHHQPGGHPRTGLSETTWFYAFWLCTVKVGEVERFNKFVPEHLFAELRTLIESAGRQ